MAYVYVPGTERGRRHAGASDGRGDRPARGWTAEAELTDGHPVTGRPLPDSPWWIREVFAGPASTRPHHH